jgi:prepilin-type N-terminal cleavage/methylation domain-containing protein
MWKKGFTLLELVVVIGLIAVISTVAFAHFINLTRDQILINASSDMVNFFRLAQTNAKSAVKCGENHDVQSYAWSVYISDPKTLNLYCHTTSSPVFAGGVFDRDFSLASGPVIIHSLSSLTIPLQIDYSALYGEMKFRTDSVNYSTVANNALEIKLQNTVTGEFKGVVINTAGSVDLKDYQ